MLQKTQQKKNLTKPKSPKSTSFFAIYRLRKIVVLMIILFSIIAIIFSIIWLNVFNNFLVKEKKFYQGETSKGYEERKIFYGLIATVSFCFTIAFLIGISALVIFLRDTGNCYSLLRLATWIFILAAVLIFVLISFIPGNSKRYLINRTTGEPILDDFGDRIFIELAKPNYVMGWLTGFSAMFLAIMSGIARREFGFAKNDKKLQKYIKNSI